jgi:heavy metal translocating P-type ATPase
MSAIASSSSAPAHKHDHQHGHDHHHHDGDPVGMACCSHHNVKLEQYMRLYLVGGVLLLASVLAKYVFSGAIPGAVADLPAIVGAVLLGMPLFIAAVKEIWRGAPSTSTLCALAILASLANQHYTTAGFLAFILLVADSFVRQRAWGADRAIQDLVSRAPDTARVIRNNTETEVPLADVRIGDIIRVRVGENLPVDGVVVTGRSTIDQAALTGESMPHEVEPGEPVYAGTTNLSALIEIRATQVGQDTTIGKVSQLIREAEQSRTTRQLMVEQVARFFVPVTIMVAFAVWFMTHDLDRAITVLVVACPSALLLASPLSMVAAFASAARLGILIKKTNYLEQAASIDTVVMDKTGTITTGKFAVSRLVPADGVDGVELLQAAVNGEQHSTHPLAKSIMQTAAAARIQPDGSTEYEEIHGRGIRARTTIGEVCVGRASWLTELFPAIKDQVAAVESRIEGMSGVHVVRDGRYLGVVGLEDRIRPNAKNVIARLRELGVREINILTGDRLSVAERVGRSVGVDTVEAECHPEEKHNRIQDLVRSGRRVLMIGDGINDGPSLAAADIGVAMGLGGSDIAANSAGVALMNDDLSRVPFLIELSRRTRAIVAQNIGASIVIAIVGLIAAATGYLPILGAALYHVVGDIFVIGNSFRLFRFGEAFSETQKALMDQTAEQTPRRTRTQSLTLRTAAAATA